MRPLQVFLVVLGVLAGGSALWSAAQPEAAPGPRIGRLLGTDGGAGAAPQVRVLYQYVDDGGAVRIVESPDAVPADRRAGMGRIEVPVAVAQPARAAQTPEIVIYTTAWCGFCRKMVRALEDHGLPYTNRDIERDPGARRELLQLVGSTGVPVTVVDGQLIRGYDPARLRELVADFL